jgi:hypothetical protein
VALLVAETDPTLAEAPPEPTPTASQDDSMPEGAELAEVSDAVDSAYAAEWDAESTTARIDIAMRELLVLGDARFPTGGLSEPAQDWIQARVEAEFNAGVLLIGSGERDQDGMRELIWLDAAGQLLVSSGSAVLDLADTSEIPSTFEDGIRLRPTERFVALSDFSGDGIGDWVVEDVSTGDVWIIDGETLDVTAAQDGNQAADWLLVGHADFDADGREEFIWQRADGGLQLGHPSGDLPSMDTLLPISESSRLLAVADLNGDGHDDLLSVDLDGRLELNLLVAVGSDFEFESRPGPDLSTDALELLSSLDADEDGEAEIAWLNGDELEIWDPETGPQGF